MQTFNKRPIAPGPAGIIFYLSTEPLPKPTIVTEEQFDDLRGYEPTKEFKLYEDYLNRAEQLSHVPPADFTLYSVAYTRDTLDEVYLKVESDPHFVRWMV